MISKEINMSDEATLEDWQLLAQVGQIFRSLSDSFADQVDMHRGQSILLCTISKQDGMTQSEIANQLSIQGATVTNMLQKMEEAGLVVRRRDANDNRLVRVYVTQEGQRKETELQQQFLNMQEMMFKGFNVKDRETLRRLLLQVLENMGGQA